MPKPIDRPVPTSSVARLFDHAAATRAIAQPGSVAVAQSRLDTPADGPPPNAARVINTGLVKRELVLTSEADEALSCLVTTLRQATGTRLNASHVARATLTAIAPAIESIAARAICLRPLRLPPKAKGQDLQRQAFEQQLADVIRSALAAAKI